MATSDSADYPPLPDKQYFTIGEAAALTLTKPYVLRYWEKQIGAPKSLNRRHGGRRYYTVADIQHLRRVHHLITRQGLTTDGVRRLLASERKKDIKSGDAVIAGAAGATSDAHQIAADRRNERLSLRRELEKIIELL